MKKMFLSAALLAATVGLSSCGSTASSLGTSALGNLLTSGTSSSTTSTTTSSVASTGASVLTSLLSNVLSSSTTLSQDAIVGTWNYQEPDVVFESSNLLLKAGGEVAATKVESEISSAFSKVGIKKGSCSFTFNSDNTYSANLGGRTISGNYTLDTKNKTITLTYLAGVSKVTPKVSLSGSTLSLLFESDKLLTLVSAASALTGSSSLSTLSSIASSYDGMYIGLKLKK